MWSPKKLNFLFYDFSVIYYDFFKDSAERNTNLLAGLELVVTEEKVHITSLNFCESPLFLSEISNRVNHLPELLKSFVLPLRRVISGFVFFFFIYFG